VSASESETANLAPSWSTSTQSAASLALSTHSTPSSIT